MEYELNYNQAVFTTKSVMSNQVDIVRVYHENDGDWQFHGDDIPDNDDAFILSLGEIIEFDSTLAEIVKSMPCGKIAIRASKKDSWHVIEDVSNK